MYNDSNSTILSHIYSFLFYFYKWNYDTFFHTKGLDISINSNFTSQKIAKTIKMKF
jgi:hypothetical protein